MAATDNAEVMATLALALNPALVAVLGYLLKRWLDRLEVTIQTLVTNQHKGQIDLVCNYQTKSDAKTDADRQWEKIDLHGERITRLETLVEDGK